MKLLATLFFFISISIGAHSQSLRVSENGRYLERADGTSFIWIGDTGWELFHRLDREEATHYLTTRAEQGFTLIQAVILAEQDGLRTPNSYGELPLIDLDPSQPNEAYFEHVDFIVKKANELGLVMGLLPTWGDKLYSEHPGAGPIVFNKENGKKFGQYLGNRYKEKEVVWILGGDRNVANEEVHEIWREMASGLAEGDGGQHLMSYHPRGESSSSYFWHDEPWLDMNMYQSGHARRFNHVYQWVETDYLKLPPKPVIDGEPAYESIPLRFWEYCDFSKPLKVPEEVLNEERIIQDSAYFEEGFFTDYDVRIHAYWNFLSGAAGYTYGNNAVWQMFKKKGPIAIPCLADWKASLTHKGATQLKHVKKLMEMYDLAELVPDQSIIYGRNPRNENHIRAAKSVNGDWAIIYLAQGQKVKVDLNEIQTDDEMVISWYDPRTGEKKTEGAYEAKGMLTFTPPTSGKNQDWVLLLN